MNLANILTVSRIFLTLVFGSLAQMTGTWGALWLIVVFTAASLTDFFDGYVARKYNLTTTFGKIMDPIADKCLTLTAMFIFSFEGTIALWMVMIVAVREILVTASRISAVTRGVVIPAEKAGKMKTVSQVVLIAIVLLYRFLAVWSVTRGAVENFKIPLFYTIQAAMIAVVVLTVWSGWMYLENLRKYEK